MYCQKNLPFLRILFQLIYEIVCCIFYQTNITVYYQTKLSERQYIKKKKKITNIIYINSSPFQDKQQTSQSMACTDDNILRVESPTEVYKAIGRENLDKAGKSVEISSVDVSLC